VDHILQDAVSMTFIYPELEYIEGLGRGHTILTSRELVWCYTCSWDVPARLSEACWHVCRPELHVRSR